MYEAADYAVSQPDLEQAEMHTRKVGGLESDWNILTSDIVQSALAFLDRDLAVVESGLPTWGGLRRQSVSEGQPWAATLP